MRYQTLEAAYRYLPQLNLWAIPASWPQKVALEKWKPYQNAAPDQATVDRWLRRWPLAAAAIPTGPATVIVIDADSIEAVRELNRRGLPRTWATSTTRGNHYFFQPPQNVKVCNSAAAIAPKVDCRGCGGFAILYPWIHGYGPDDVELAPMPEWLLAHFREKAERRVASPPAPARPFTGIISGWARAAFDGELNKLIDARNGTRHDTLIKVASNLGALVAGGELDRGQVERSILAIVTNWDKEPVETSRRALMDGLAYGAQRPRSRVA